jgi:hypothetical protein
MNHLRPLAAAGLLLLTQIDVSAAEILVRSQRIAPELATPAFPFSQVPGPCRKDAAEQARFELLNGQKDPNGGALECLVDGKLPGEEDQPQANFFFAAGGSGGRLRIDLGKVIDVWQVNSYSWHPGGRGPQVYRLFASDGLAPGFNVLPGHDSDPAQLGWKFIARVDTTSKETESGGQYGVSISSSEGSLGQFRYLLVEVERTDPQDRFGHTFYSELDVIGPEGGEPVEAPASPPCQESFAVAGGAYHIRLDTCVAPDLADWARQELIPMVEKWYPRLVRELASAGFVAPTTIPVRFDNDPKGVAATSGARITCSAPWFRANLKGEALGAVFHELVHVIQQYGRRRSPSAVRNPGWLVEGIADYMRWYHFEPQSRGAEISRSRLAKVRYDNSYRVTANFLDWASRKYRKDLVPRLNAAMREGKYTPELWQELTGKTAPELGEEWKQDLQKADAEQGQDPTSAGREER